MRLRARPSKRSFLLLSRALRHWHGDETRTARCRAAGSTACPAEGPPHKDSGCSLVSYWKLPAAELMCIWTYFICVFVLFSYYLHFNCTIYPFNIFFFFYIYNTGCCCVQFPHTALLNISFSSISSSSTTSKPDLRRKLHWKNKWQKQGTTW